MVTVVNLRTARKQRARAAARVAAASSAARHGEAAAELRRRAAQHELDERRLDAHRVENPGEPVAD